MSTPANDPNVHRDPFGGIKVAFCNHHMEAMRRNIMAHGLWPRVSKDHAELKRRHARFDPYDIDPLELLHNMIYGKCRHTAAINAPQMRPREMDGRCPVCFFGVGHWIEEAGDAVAKRFIELDIEKLADQERNRELEADQGKKPIRPVAREP